MYVSNLDQREHVFGTALLFSPLFSISTSVPLLSCPLGLALDPDCSDIFGHSPPHRGFSKHVVGSWVKFAVTALARPSHKRVYAVAPLSPHPQRAMRRFRSSSTG